MARSDPFAAVIALRDALAQPGGSQRHTVRDAHLRSALQEATRPTYERVAQRFAARTRSPGDAVAEQLLPPLRAANAASPTRLSVELGWEPRGAGARATLELESALARAVELTFSAQSEAARALGASITSLATLAPGERRALEIAFTSTPSAGGSAAFDLGDGERALLRVFVVTGGPAHARAVLREVDSVALTALRGLQRVLVEHPTPARELCAALIAEGREFAKGDDGAAWLARLQASPLLEDARLVLQLASLALLENLETPAALPSAYLDAFFMAAASDDADALLDRLFGGGGP